MLKKITYLIASLVLLAAVTACSAVQSLTGANSAQANAPQAGGTPQPGGRNGGAFGGDPATMTVEQKMGIGILKMEGTNTAVTAAQAKDLLPLWQALKSMETSNNASVDEINAVFTQMKDTLTPDQVTSIQKLTWTQADMTAIMQQYGVQGGGFGGQNGTVSPGQQATFAARRAAGGGFGGPGGGAPGGAPGGGAPGGGFGGQGGNGGTGGNNTTGGATRTPSPAQLNRRAIGFNSVFIDPVIKLLTTKSAQ